MPSQVPFALAPDVAAGLLLSAALAFFAPVIAAAVWRRRSGAPLWIWAAGAVVFFVSQVVLRFPWQIPLGKWVHANSVQQPWLMTAFLLFSSLTAGIFEEWGRWVGYRTMLKANREPRDGVMFGLGHGGAESILLVGLSTGGTVVVAWLIQRGTITAGPVVEGLQKQLAGANFWSASLAGAERLIAMAMHVGLSLIVLQAFARGGVRWVWLAVLLHFAVNALGITAVKQIGAYQAEALVAVLGVSVLSLGLKLSRDRAGKPVHPGSQELRAKS
jgi:uncharacterized membrane protein YhfC